jgi:hypothetical protein
MEMSHPWTFITSPHIKKNLRHSRTLTLYEREGEFWLETFRLGTGMLLTFFTVMEVLEVWNTLESLLVKGSHEGK